MERTWLHAMRGVRAALLLWGALGLMAASSAAAADNPITITTVHDWTLQRSICAPPPAVPTGSVSFVIGPATPPLGTGSLQLAVGADGNSFEMARLSSLHGRRLADLTALSYSSFVGKFGSGGQAPYIVLDVDLNGDNVVDDQLFFEPVYQNGAFNAALPNQGSVTLNTWQTWNALVGGWYSLNGLGSATPGAGVKALAQYVAAVPSARILNSSTGLGGLRIAAGCGAPDWNTFVGFVDDVTVGLVGRETVTYNFEVTPRTSTTVGSRYDERDDVEHERDDD